MKPKKLSANYNKTVIAQPSKDRVIRQAYQNLA